MQLKHPYKHVLHNARLSALCNVLFGSLLFFTCSLSSEASVLRAPLDIKLRLSANFAELRPDHFHGGVDFKTRNRKGEAVTGLPIYAPADGYISHVEVSPTGYGNGIIVNHPLLGLTTVYGHLEKFTPEIEAEVLRRQMLEESFSVSIDFPPYLYPVKVGEKIGLSGNTGNSFGPHLHYEVRDNFTNYHLDPLKFYKDKIPDHTPPEVLDLNIFAKPGEGVVDCFTAWGRIFPAIRAYDRMDDQANSYGVRTITLKVDNQIVFTRTLNYFHHDRARDVNTLTHYPTLLSDGKWMEWTCVPASMPLPDGTLCAATYDGAVVIDEERDYKCEFILTDLYGNSTSRRFTISGKKMNIPTLPEGQKVSWLYGGSIQQDDVNIDIAPRTLYDDVELIVSCSDTQATVRPSVGAVPVTQPFEVTIKMDAAVVDNPNYYVMTVADKDGRRVALPTSWAFTNDGRIAFTGKTTAWGKFAITTDLTPPTITAQENDLTFTITDNLSGILDIRAEINGEYVVMNYSLEPGTDPLRPGTLRLKSGTKKTTGGGVFTLRVMDRVGNTAAYTKII